MVDPQRPSGRIAALHSTHSKLEVLQAEIDALLTLDPRIRTITLPTLDELSPLAARWFHRSVPLRCQAGTPILAFAYAFEAASENLVLRADCDMLFYDKGWLEEAAEQVNSGTATIVEPPRLGRTSEGTVAVSTRALVVSAERLRRTLLPMPAHKLDYPRRIHRWLHRRPPWLALEQMFDAERVSGRLQHVVLPEPLGYSVHVISREDASSPGFSQVVAAIEMGDIPPEQRSSWNYVPDAWHNRTVHSALA